MLAVQAKRRAFDDGARRRADPRDRRIFEKDRKQNCREVILEEKVQIIEKKRYAKFAILDESKAARHSYIALLL